MVSPAPNAVVIADDDPDDLFFARRCLQKAGVKGEILTCTDGVQIVRLLEGIARENKPLPQVIFLDVKMPILNGIETLRWIRTQEAFDRVPIVMLSGSNEARDVELARSLGALAYLVKYPHPEEIARLLATAGATPGSTGGEPSSLPT